MCRRTEPGSGRTVAKLLALRSPPPLRCSLPSVAVSVPPACPGCNRGGALGMRRLALSQPPPPRAPPPPPPPPPAFPRCLLSPPPSPPRAPLCLSGGGSLACPSLPRRCLSSSAGTGLRTGAAEAAQQSPSLPRALFLALCASKGARTGRSAGCKSRDRWRNGRRSSSSWLLPPPPSPAGCCPRPGPSWGFSSSCFARPTSSGCGGE